MICQSAVLSYWFWCDQVNCIRKIFLGQGWLGLARQDWQHPQVSSPVPYQIGQIALLAPSTQAFIALLALLALLAPSTQVSIALQIPRTIGGIVLSGPPSPQHSSKYSNLQYPSSSLNCRVSPVYQLKYHTVNRLKSNYINNYYIHKKLQQANQMQALTQPALNLNLSSLIPFAIPLDPTRMAISDTAAFISQHSHSQSLSSASMSGNFAFLRDSEVRQMSELNGNATHFVLAFS